MRPISFLGVSCTTLVPGLSLGFVHLIPPPIQLKCWSPSPPRSRSSIASNADRTLLPREAGDEGGAHADSEDAGDGRLLVAVQRVPQVPRRQAEPMHQLLVGVEADGGDHEPGQQTKMTVRGSPQGLTFANKPHHVALATCLVHVGTLIPCD
eukprot:gene6055-biopygen20810